MMFFINCHQLFSMKLHLDFVSIFQTILVGSIVIDVKSKDHLDLTTVGVVVAA